MMDVRRNGRHAGLILFLALFLCLAGSLQVKAMKLSTSKIRLDKGSSRKIYLEGAKGPVIWKSSNRQVVTVKGGKIYAQSGGTTYVRATCCGRKYYCQVKVVGLNRRRITMAPGQSYKLKMYNGQNINWSTDNSVIAEVSKDGKVLAKAPGPATITCTSNNKKYVCKIYVAELNAYSLSMEEGESFTLVRMQSDAKPRWSSDDPTVARVSSNGTVTAVSGGQAVITCLCGSAILRCQISVAGDYNVVSQYDVPVTKSHRKLVTVRGPFRDLHYYVYNQASSKNRIQRASLKSYLPAHGCAGTTASTILGGMLGREIRPAVMITRIERKIFGEKSWKRNYKKNGRRMPVCLNGISKIYSAYHINTTYVRQFTDSQAREQITRHLKRGNPIIFVVSKKNRKTGKKNGKWTNGYDTMARIGMTKDGKVIVADSVNRPSFGSAQRLKLTTLNAILPYMFPATKIKDNNYWGSSRSSGGYLLVYSNR